VTTYQFIHANVYS